MQWKVLKQVQLHEVQNRVKEFENLYGSLSLLYEEFNKGRMSPNRFDDYIEWTGMNHALRAYQEGEDLEFLAERVLELLPNEYRKITTRRLELLDHLIEFPANSINELAKNIGRNIKNVYTDLIILEKFGFISLNKEGKNTKPEPLVQEITLILGKSFY